MKFAINAPNFGIYADPEFVIALTRVAEVAGWDGFFLWDHIRPGPVPLGDPWLLLTAIALNSERLVLGPMVTPLPRRKPGEVARQATTLDHISGGRLVLGVGLGDDGWREFSAFGPYPDDRTRAQMLDEGLDVITALWRGEPVTHTGRHYAVADAVFSPTPLQQPRIPIWVAGRWPSRRPFDRAARWDGAFPVNQAGAMTAAICRELVDYVAGRRDAARTFEMAVAGPGDPAERARDLAAEFAAAGATWYQVGLSAISDRASALRLVEQGPPRA